MKKTLFLTASLLMSSLAIATMRLDIASDNPPSIPTSVYVDQDNCATYMSNPCCDDKMPMPMTINFRVMEQDPSAVTFDVCASIQDENSEPMMVSQDPVVAPWDQPTTMIIKCPVRGQAPIERTLTITPCKEAPCQMDSCSK